MTISFRTLDAGESVILQSNGRDTHHIIGGVSNAAGLGHVIEDEGTPLTQRATLNFVGVGVTATDDAITGKTVVTVPAPPEKNIVWNLKDTEANSTGAKPTHWQVPFACTITGWALANPNAVNATTAVDVRRTTDANYPGTWDASPLNTAPLSFTVGVKNSGGASDFTTIALNAGDWLRVEITTADSALTDLIFVLKVTVA